MSLTKEEAESLSHLSVGSENSPLTPAFPPDDPYIQATSCYQIDIPGFSNVWLKDESQNPTGTHKDRLACEIVVTYRQFLRSRQKGDWSGTLPQMSIISSGSAAVAIQTALKRHRLPHLKVLVDFRLSKTLLEKLEAAGCKIFRTDLARKALGRKEILTLTNNDDGIDITSGVARGPTHKYYDCLSYEIINENPRYCFVPFGTGNLYENILNISKEALASDAPELRFSGCRAAISKCDFLGATTNDPSTKAEKLYAPHLPFVHFDEQWIRIYKLSGYCGRYSNIHRFEEKFLEEAMSLAEKLSINAEPSGLAGLALLLQMKDSLERNQKILVVNTGKVQ